MLGLPSCSPGTAVAAFTGLVLASLPHPARLPAEPTRAGVLLLKVPFTLSRGRSCTPGGYQQRVETVLVVATETGIALGI